VNPFEILKNAQEIQKRMAEAQERLGDIRVKGSAGGGMVEVTVNGRLEAQSVKISPDALVPAEGGEASAGADMGFLEDLVLMAIRDAHAKARDEIGRELGGMAGLGMGGLTGMPDIPGAP
jgi:nucleoid-associated protein EbfC